MNFTKPAGRWLYAETPGQITRVMKLTFLMITALLLHVSAATKAQISLKEKNTPLAEVLKSLKRQSGYDFFYNDGDVANAKPVTAIFNNISLEEALTFCLKGQELTYVIEDKTVVIRQKSRAVSIERRQQPGRISGKVIDEKGETLPGATIKIIENGNGVVTTVDGNYLLIAPSGTYTLEVSFIGYQTQRISGVVVKESEVTIMDVALKPTTATLNEVVISTTFRQASVQALYARQKNNASMTNGISAEQIAQTPDNNAAQILKRISGITVQGDKFVTIRGVSDRYNNVLINGASLPSTEPNRRNFSFDIVPSGLIDNIVVNKTASPDLPGDFTGGLAQINTKDIPEENFLSFSLGTGTNTASANRDFMGYKRDAHAALGIVDKERKWFGDGRVFDPAVYVQKVTREQDLAYRAQVASQIPNHWQPYRYAYAPMRNYQLSGGVSKKLANGHSLGFIAAATYRNEMLAESGEFRVLQQSDYQSQRYKYSTSLGGVLNAAYKTDKFRLAWKNLYSHKYTNQFDEQSGAFIGQGKYAQRRADVTLTNTLVHTRLEGEYAIGKKGIKIDAYGDYIPMTREQPDSRLTTPLTLTGIDAANPTFVFDPDKAVLAYVFNNPSLVLNGLYGSVLKEKKKNAGANFSLPFRFAGDKQLFKIGYAVSDRGADFDGTGIGVQEGPGGYVAATTGLPYYQVVTQEAFSKGFLYYTTNYTRGSTTGDRYTGKQLLKASYAMLDLKLLKNLRATGGFRYEDNKTAITTVLYKSGAAEFGDTLYREKDWLPSVNLNYSVSSKISVRAAYSKTIARPDFVERSPYIYYDFSEMAEVIGQQSLEATRTKNYDLRLEYYPSGNEIISASVFYKDFDKPVERFYNIGSQANAVVYRNLFSATAKGFEIDFRKSLSFINESNLFKNMYLSGNYTYLKGEIKYAITQDPNTKRDTFFIASSGRPIQGLAPYIINGALSYQGKNWNFNVGYNRFGRRIVNGGTNATITQYENPRDVMDLQLGVWLMKRRAELKFNVSDFLNQDYIIYSNNARLGTDGGFPGEAPNLDPKGEAYNAEQDFTNYKVKKGTNFSFSITYRFF